MFTTEEPGAAADDEESNLYNTFVHCTLGSNLYQKQNQITYKTISKLLIVNIQHRPDTSAKYRNISRDRKYLAGNENRAHK